MKHAIVGLTALCSVVCLTLAPRAEARGIRADIPCPYGGGANTWSSTGPVSSTQFNPGAATSYSAQLNGSVNTDDINLSVTGATMYAWYSAPIPSASLCGTTLSNGDQFSAPSPIEEVIAYTLSSGDTLNSPNGQSSISLPTGGTEVEFNYAISGAGQASFTMDGVTYKSTALTLPSTTANDFIFNANGSLFGAISEDGTYVTQGGLPSGWSATSGTVSAPEIDSASAIGALTLLAGCLAVLRGGRRTLDVEGA
jgi:hypothetical protein